MCVCVIEDPRLFISSRFSRKKDCCTRRLDGNIGLWSSRVQTAKERRLVYQNNDTSPGIYDNCTWESGTNNMFMLLDKIRIVKWRSWRHESGHGSEVWNEQIQSDFIQDVSAITYCSVAFLFVHTLAILLDSWKQPPLPSVVLYFHTMSAIPSLARRARSSYCWSNESYQPERLSVAFHLVHFTCLICWGVVHPSQSTALALCLF